MTALLNALGSTGLSAGIMILAVLILRLRFQDRTPRRVFCLLWDVTLLRLLAPVELPSPVSIRRFLPSAAREIVRQPIPLRPGTADMDLVWETSQAALAEDVPAGAFSALPWAAILAILWLAGALALAGWLLGGHMRCRGVYGASLPLRDDFILDWLAGHPLRRPVQVRVSDRLASPLTCGVWYPVILLPKGMDLSDRNTLSWVLAHEHAHIRRFDAVRKGFLAAALCLHWYNPLVWAMYLLANRDMELACDEAVLRRCGDREGYALALLDMEERRGHWSFYGSCFSQNALEERIKAIMKQKHISMTALIAVLLVMCVTTTVFASAAPVEKGNPPAAAYVEALADDGVIISNGKTGEKQYSADGGVTWMDEERYHARYGGWGDDWTVEWWTYDGYRDWLEREKVDLREIIGSKGWTPSTGWFTWDRKKVDETIAMYEDTLEEIRQGALYSKRIVDRNGNEVEDVMLGSGTLIASGFEASGGDSVIEKPVDTARILKELEAFGVTGSVGGGLRYKGQAVRCLVDGVFVGDGGYAVQYVYNDESGVVDVHTLRSVICHPDGSYDPLGDLIGVVTAGDEGFDQDLISAGTFSSGPQAVAAHAAADGTGEQGRSFEEIFSQYAGFGLTYCPREGSMGALSYNGQPVCSFADLMPDGGCFSYQDPYAETGLKLRTVYDDGGKLAGLEVQ